MTFPNLITVKKKEKYFYLNNVIIAQTYEIDDDGDHENLEEDECIISVHVLKMNKCLSREQKPVLSLEVMKMHNFLILGTMT